jgi:hypothetical protein
MYTGIFLFLLCSLQDPCRQNMIVLSGLHPSLMPFFHELTESDFLCAFTSASLKRWKHNMSIHKCKIKEVEKQFFHHLIF